MNTITNKRDVFILLSVIALMLFSIAALYSASSYYALQTKGSAEFFAKMHIPKVLLAIFLVFVLSKVDYNLYKNLSKYLIWLTILLLILVLFIGTTKNNATRWLQIFSFSFQPSDLAKYTLIIHLSLLLSKKKDYVHLLYKGYLPLLFYIVLITLLIALQPNFSTAIIIFCTSITLLFISNVRFKHLLVTFVLLLPLLVFFMYHKQYAWQRLVKYKEFSGNGRAHLQLEQALVGLGNGGLYGVGPGNSFQKELFLPEAYGDFIFAIVGEEYGFIGTSLIILVFILLIFRGYKISKTIEDDFGKYLSFGITTMLAAYAIVNTAVATGIFPVTGVPMPFISYGGTALIINSVGIGILLNISSQCKKRNNENLIINEG
ncbi:MAG: FtsW/RodA/SpoVE family cell cycle protein [Ignavibacteria bacterium]|nr:FtsW/RodA/SpoVE family cell cycle protein [Ignavibacteria bacterium]